MTRYLICVDGSEHADLAFKYCITKLLRKEDKVFLISVLETINAYPYSTGFIYRQDDEQHRKILRHYCILCRRRGVTHYTPILGQGDHVGAVICDAVNKENIDTVVIGRRKMSGFKRFLSGSNSKYVMEHCDCNVLVVKGNFLEESHTPVEDVVRLEERERSRRMKDTRLEREEKDQEQQCFQRIAEAAEEVMKRSQHMMFDLNPYISIMEEEQEKLMRLSRCKGQTEEELAHKEAALISAEFKKLELRNVSPEEENDATHRLRDILRVVRTNDKLNAQPPGGEGAPPPPPPTGVATGTQEEK